MRGRKNQLAGQRFGLLTALHSVPRAVRKRGDNALWLCRCECGEKVVVPSDRLIGGLKKACARNGHFWAGVRSSVAKKYPSEYRSWQHMRRRCLYSGHHRYASYGGRGITICPQWNDFSKFIEDMGVKPSPEYTIERIDVNGNYEPSNCRWATREEQYRNTTRSIYVEYEGKRQLLIDVVASLGLKRSVVYGRLKAGWSLEATLAIPVGWHTGRKPAP